MAKIKKGIKLLFNYFSFPQHDRELYIPHRTNHRILSELEAYDIYLCEAREADKYIHSMRFLP